jgi:hypothetical protein
MNKDSYLIFEAYTLNGLAKNKTLEDIAKKHNACTKDLENQLLKGIEIEFEHTKDEETAKTIAMDHIFEDPKYYDKLKKIEGENQEIRAYAPSESNEELDVSKYKNIIDKLAEGSFDTESEVERVDQGAEEGVFDVEVVDGKRQVVLTNDAVKSIEAIYPEL